ncbi:MAG: PAS domain-containing sensor histidine kinase [Candidatus Kapabacteria bacterium]|jgi:PAS domain S-box-containing protein|nr:PAS domain-containing sensor histidine kinase [Candidatus Kapabacteria bacterium]
MTQIEHQAFNALAVGVFALDKYYTVRAWNSRLSEWTGLEAGALVGTDIRLWFAHWRANDFRDALSAIWQTKELVNLESLPSVIPSYFQGSTQRTKLASARLYTAADGETVALFTLQDITPQAQEIEHFKTSMVEIEEAWRNDEEIRILNEELEKRVEERTEELARLNNALTKEITVRKQVEEAFRHSEHLLSLIFENAAVGLALLHQNGRYIRLNQMFCRIFGFSVEELLGKHFAYLYAEEERTAAIERWEQIIHGETTTLSGDRHFKLRNGNEIDIYFTTVRFTTADGEVRVITTGTDITEIKRAEEEMRLALEREQELNKLKANFVTAVSHEFRTPLTVIFSSSEILQAQPNMVQEKREKMHFQIERSVKRMTELLDEVVFIERSMRERTIAFPRPNNIYKIVADVIAELEVFDRQQHSISVQYIGFEGEPGNNNPAFVLPLDAGLVRPVVSHLLSNALKFSPPETPVKMILERTQKDLRITVKDKGIGIPEHEQSYIYDLFFRASNVGITQGTGMGLTIVKRCVDAHGGVVMCDSHLTTGTVFRVQIPLQ